MSHDAAGNETIPAGRVRLHDGGDGTPSNVLTDACSFRVIATTRASTAERELQQAATAGFRIALAPQSPNEWLFVLQGISAGSQPFQYRFVELRKDTMNEQLRSAEADGYHAVGGVDLITVLEKPSAP